MRTSFFPSMCFLSPEVPLALNLAPINVIKLIRSFSTLNIQKEKKKQREVLCHCAMAANNGASWPSGKRITVHTICHWSDTNTTRKARVKIPTLNFLTMRQDVLARFIRCCPDSHKYVTQCKLKDCDPICVYIECIDWPIYSYFHLVLSFQPSVYALMSRSVSRPCTNIVGNVLSRL